MGLLKAERILIVSILDVDCRRVFEIYKQREKVEGHFDIFKNTLHSNALYLQDAESFFGHLFFSFLSLYDYCVLQNILRNGGLLESISHLDLLEELSSVYAITDGEKTILTAVPKKVKKLDDRLATDLFPKKS